MIKIQKYLEFSMEWDLILSYGDTKGFRCKACYNNILTIKKLQLKALIIEKVMKFLNRVKKYQGEFVFIWHNSDLFESSNKNIYKKIILRRVV